MPSEDFDGKQFKNTSPNFFKFLTGTSATHLPCRYGIKASTCV